MNEMKLCIILLIVVLILLIACIHHYSNLHGGAMPPTRGMEGERTTKFRLSLSQITYLLYRRQRADLYDRTLELCERENYKATVSLGERTFHIRLPKDFKASYVSDAFIDMISWQEVHLEDAFVGVAAEEVQSDDLSTYHDEVWSEIHHGVSSLSDFPESFRNSLRNESNKETSIGFQLMPASTNLTTKNSTRNAKVHRRIYIEFIYTSMKTLFRNFYNEIHKTTREIFEKLKTMKYDVAIIQIRREYERLNGDIQSEWKYELDSDTFDTKTIVINKLYSTKAIHLPSTNDSLLMDEAILINNDLMQIEHSEGGESHKNNMIEFLLRWLYEDENIGLSDEYKFEIIKYVLNNRAYDKEICFSFINGISLSEWNRNAIAKLFKNVIEETLGISTSNKRPLLPTSPTSSTTTSYTSPLNLNQIPNPYRLLGLNKHNLSISPYTQLLLYMNDNNRMRIRVNNGTPIDEIEDASQSEFSFTD